jgi:hypothetical protein
MDEENDPPPRTGKPSSIPSWVMLGFVLGALFVVALPRRAPLEAPPGPEQNAAVKPAKPAPAPRLTTIEAVFAAWERYAVWSDNTTQVALWDADTMSYSDCYEVLRIDDGYFFRSISKLTRPILTHGVVEESPLQFTESARQRQEWLREVDSENLKALSEAARQSFEAPAPPAKK